MSLIPKEMSPNSTFFLVAVMLLTTIAPVLNALGDRNYVNIPSFVDVAGPVAISIAVKVRLPENVLWVCRMDR